MDALKALAGQQGCSADGTAVSRNPLSQFVSQVGKDVNLNHQQINSNGGSGRFQNQGISQKEIENAMNAGMGLQQGPVVRGPAMMNPEMMVNEFNRSRQQQFQQGPMVTGPQHQQPVNNNNWVQQFENMNMGPRNFNQMQNLQNMQNVYNQNFGRQPTAMGQRWVNQVRAQPRPNVMETAWKQNAVRQADIAQNWANQMNHVQQPDAQQWINDAKNIAEQQAEAPQMEQEIADSEADALRKATADLVNVMSSDPKFQRSNFFQEMSRVASGESVITNNEIKSISQQKNELNMENVWDEVEQMMQNDSTSTENIKDLFEKAYQDQLDGKDVDLDQYFNSAMNYNYDYNSIQQNSEPQLYELKGDNRYSNIDSEENLFELGMSLFRKGELQNAILAFEAVLEKDLTSSEAWRMLGLIYQESDQDRKAIQCLENAVEHDPYNLDALLGLGVSYVNELDQKNALRCLKTWVTHNPKFSNHQPVDIYSDESNPNLMNDVLLLVTSVHNQFQHDADLNILLGVLFNVTRDFGEAAKAFETALSQRPDDYSLWNKLGATLANSSKSKEALPHYTRALELKPRYARGWLNFGISHSNLGDYTKAIRAYLRALDLNPEATHIWNYLRICLSCLEGYEHLMPEISNRNIEAFRKVFEF